MVALNSNYEQYEYNRLVCIVRNSLSTRREKVDALIKISNYNPKVAEQIKEFLAEDSK